MEEKGIRTILRTSSHMLCRAIGINDASIRSLSLRTFLRNASCRRELTADCMRPLIVLDCPMKAFTNRFSGVSVSMGTGSAPEAVRFPQDQDEGGRDEGK